MKQKRRNHSLAFKAKVVLCAAKSERPMAELSQQYGHANQILAWEKHLLSEFRELFQRGSSLSGDSGRKIQQFQAKVGKLSSC